jgi:hypothetical protein
MLVHGINISLFYCPSLLSTCNVVLVTDVWKLSRPELRLILAKQMMVTHRRKLVTASQPTVDRWDPSESNVMKQVHRTGVNADANSVTPGR